MDLVCLCKGIEKDIIIKSVKDGADTFEKVQLDTEAGTGYCRASGCKCKIEELIRENK
jgi:bacterioferritin-associated ferredoxin